MCLYLHHMTVDPTSSPALAASASAAVAPFPLCSKDFACLYTKYILETTNDLWDEREPGAEILWTPECMELLRCRKIICPFTSIFFLQKIARKVCCFPSSFWLARKQGGKYVRNAVSKIKACLILTFNLKQK